MQEAETVYTSLEDMSYLMGQENFVRQENLVIVYGSKDRLMGQEKILGLCYSHSGWGKKIISSKEIYWGHK